MQDPEPSSRTRSASTSSDQRENRLVCIGILQAALRSEVLTGESRHYVQAAHDLLLQNTPIETNAEERVEGDSGNEREERDGGDDESDSEERDGGDDESVSAERDDDRDEESDSEEEDEESETKEGDKESDADEGDETRLNEIKAAYKITKRWRYPGRCKRKWYYKLAKKWLRYFIPTKMGAMEKLLQLQDSVPCMVRAKRGCATHSRSIAERS
ncbi:transcription factor bHLH129-like isoform X2 [Amborella trichopoda]|uniref:transcription factor bHLH129-like isoform X2 n=1 Tax=Amborella trichopoda TaxID=13333 RepID=UPI0009BDD673|nr:transcription factor bHLH129-like isoform X2 [Amborella trichopoda]|eukprot:XP_020528828.1 transcription factor bHLH129-like isoform X2 [Amborella trichopoda]